jgi:hypothetical protein
MIKWIKIQIILWNNFTKFNLYKIINKKMKIIFSINFQPLIKEKKILKNKNKMIFMIMMMK